MKLTTLSILLASTSLFTACGGGGSSTTATPAAPPAAVIAVSTIVSSVPASTYLFGSEELAAFSLMNAERSACGFGLLAQSAKLDTAARNHASYLITNSQYSHYETNGLTGFTGVDPYAREVAGGYSPTNNGYGQPGEDITSFATTLTGTGTAAVRGFLAAPYHLLESLRGYKDVGVSFILNSTIVPGPAGVIPIIDFGTPTTGSTQLPGSNDVLTYPCQGSSGMNYQLAKNEAPAPVAGRDLTTLPVGHPLLVAVRNGNTLGITSATLIKVSNGASIALRAPYTKATDVNNVAYYYENEGFILPDVPLEPSTQYQATINGTNSGVVFSRTFTFTTGTGG